MDETNLREVITGTFARLALHVEPRALETLCHDATALAANTAGSVLPLISVTLEALHLDWKQRRSERETTMASVFLKPGFDIGLENVAEHGRLEAAIERLGEKAWDTAHAEAASFTGALKALPVSVPKLRALSGEIDPRDVALSQLLRRLIVVAADPAEPDRLVGVADTDLDDITRPLAGALREHRLLTQREDGTWWLVHLEILRNWRRAKEWRVAEAEAYKTIAALRGDYARLQEDSAAGEPDADRWLWMRPRQVASAIDWMAQRGLDDNPGLVAFAKTGMLVAAGRNAALAGRILRTASYFDDLLWCKRVIEAAGTWAEEACNMWSADGSGSALTNACYNGSTELVRELLLHGARPTPSPSGQWTALTIAAHAGATAAVDLLLNRLRKFGFPKRLRDDSIAHLN